MLRFPIPDKQTIHVVCDSQRARTINTYRRPVNCFFPRRGSSGRMAPTADMNVHHLELFYYVARHGGIMPAVRNIPYGIQQPAVSSQIAQLEEFAGTTLFQRRPFALTPSGEKLFEFVRPFFPNLEKVRPNFRAGRRGTSASAPRRLCCASICRSCSGTCAKNFRA
jgi:DNA-binding transcriptional LysR family regulator